MTAGALNGSLFEPPSQSHVGTSLCEMSSIAELSETSADTSATSQTREQAMEGEEDESGSSKAGLLDRGFCASSLADSTTDSQNTSLPPPPPKTNAASVDIEGEGGVVADISVGSSKAIATPSVGRSAPPSSSQSAKKCESIYLDDLKEKRAQQQEQGKNRPKRTRLTMV